MKNANEFLHALNLPKHDYNTKHANKLADIYKFFEKETVLDTKISTEEIKFGSSTIEGTKLPGTRFSVTTKHGNYSVVVPVCNSVHRAFCNLLNIDIAEPETKAPKVQHIYSFPAEVLAVLKTAVKFTSPDDLRPAMQCLNLEINKGKLQIIATDAHRLFLSRLFDIEGTAGNHSFLIDMEQIKLLPKKLKESFGVEIYENNTARIGDTEIQLFTGAKFPDYKVVVPDYKKSVSFDRTTFIKTIKQVLPYANKSTNQVLFTFNGQIDMSAQDVDFSFEGGFRMPYIQNEIDDFVIAFNGKFIVDMLGELHSDTVKMFSDGLHNRAAIFTDGLDSVLIMPLIIATDSYYNDRLIKSDKPETSTPPAPKKVAKKQKAVEPEPVPEEETTEAPVEVPAESIPEPSRKASETVTFWKDVLDVHYNNWQNVFVHVYPDRISIRSISITDGELIKASNTIDMDAELAKQLVPVLAEIAQKHGKELIYKK